MLAAGYSFRLFFYVEFAFAVALLIATFFLVPETKYKRKVLVSSTNIPNNITKLPKKEGVTSSAVPTDPASQERTSTTVEVEGRAVTVARKSYLASLKPWSTIDREADFWMMIVRAFTYYLVPQVLWVITTFGSFIHALPSVSLEHWTY